jgi:hypothetical protein
MATFNRPTGLHITYGFRMKTILSEWYVNEKNGGFGLCRILTTVSNPL